MSLESFLFKAGVWAGIGFTHAFARTAIKLNEMSGNYPTQSRSQNAESRRLAGCRQVVMEYAEALGFIARECISRDELEHFIDRGIEPDALAAEIQRRIDA